MARKTIARATYNSVPIDPKKVNESYAYVVENDNNAYENIIEVQAEKEVLENANTEEIDFETGEIVETTTVVNNVPPAQENMPEKRVERGF